MTIAVVPPLPDVSVVRRIADDIGCSPWEPSWAVDTVLACQRDIAHWIVPEVPLRRQITVPGAEGLTTYVIAVVDGYVVECTVEVPPKGEEIPVQIRFITDPKHPGASAESLFTHTVEMRMRAAVISHLTWLRSATARELAAGLKTLLAPSVCQNLALNLSNSGTSETGVRRE